MAKRPRPAKKPAAAPKERPCTALQRFDILRDPRCLAGRLSFRASSGNAIPFRMRILQLIDLARTRMDSRIRSEAPPDAAWPMSGQRFGRVLKVTLNRSGYPTVNRMAQRSGKGAGMELCCIAKILDVNCAMRYMLAMRPFCRVALRVSSNRIV